VNAQRPVVLIIDDHPEIRKVMALLLQKEFNVIQCDGDAAAVALAADKQPCLILCDAVMPRIAGHQLVALLAADPLTAHIPVLIVTGKTEWEDWKDQPIAGMLRKPFAADELMQTVRHILNTSAQRFDSAITSGIFGANSD
jgi:CheY-like chemotaxis protein